MTGVDGPAPIDTRVYRYAGVSVRHRIDTGSDPHPPRRTGRGM
ncbi:hypothetical protein STXM2123_3711 [Streptomyces sp. F-3]|nr:hypothetical protein STXM2123_3711 [Streptomyces sp. F-3]